VVPSETEEASSDPKTDSTNPQIDCSNPSTAKEIDECFNEELVASLLLHDRDHNPSESNGDNQEDDTQSPEDQQDVTGDDLDQN